MVYEHCGRITLSSLIFIILGFVVTRTSTNHACYPEGVCFRANVTMCRAPGRSSMIQRTRTRSGRPCQYWASQRYHKHSFSAFWAAGNKCRNPKGRPGGAWCYTAAKYVRWEYCFFDCNSTTPRDIIVPKPPTHSLQMLFQARSTTTGSPKTQTIVDSQINGANGHDHSHNHN